LSILLVSYLEEANDNATEGDTGSEEQNSTNDMCKVCFQESMEYVVLPCSHLSLCLNCVARQDKCVICRKEIQF